MRRPGIYVPLSAHYADDEKVMEAGEDAELLYVRMLAYAARTPRTEGWISEAVVMTRLGIMERPDVPGSSTGNRLGKLTGTGLVIREGSGYRIASWLKWNRSAERIDREQAQDRNRKTSAKPGNSTGTRTGNRGTIQDGFLGADTETDTEERGKRRSASRPLPDDWQPKDSHRKFCEENRLDLSVQSHKFRGDAVAKDKRYARWDQAFRNWLDKAIEYGQFIEEPAKAAPQLPTIQEVKRLEAEREARERGEAS